MIERALQSPKVVLWAAMGWSLVRR